MTTKKEATKCIRVCFLISVSVEVIHHRHEHHKHHGK